MRPRTPPSLRRAIVLASWIGSSASAADPLLVPPAPNPVPQVPDAMNPVPGRPATPSARAGLRTPAVQAPARAPVICPPTQVVTWAPYGYVWGLGVLYVNAPTGYRIGLPHEPLEVTSRRLDPQALPSAPVVHEPSAQQRALALLRGARWDEASSALNVLVSHARHRASGVLLAPPGSTPTASVPAGTSPGVPSAPVPSLPPNPGAATTPTAPAPSEPQWSIGETQRLLALALLGQKRSPQAARVLTEAYANEPELCERPIPADILGAPDSLRRLMLRAVTHAQGSAQDTDAWFAAAVLMQAQGRASLPPTVAARISAHPQGRRLLDAATRPTP